MAVVDRVRGIMKPERWRYVRILGVVLAVVGVLLACLSGYSLFATPAAFQRTLAFNTASGSAPYRGNQSFNRSSFNRSQFIQSGGVAFAAQGFRVADLSNLVSGILFVLLGVLLYKYAGLKAPAPARK